MTKVRCFITEACTKTNDIRHLSFSVFAVFGFQTPHGTLKRLESPLGALLCDLYNLLRVGWLRDAIEGKRFSQISQ